MKKFNLKKVDKFQVMVSLNAQHAFKAAKSNVWRLLLLQCLSSAIFGAEIIKFQFLEAILH